MVVAEEAMVVAVAAVEEATAVAAVVVETTEVCGWCLHVVVLHCGGPCWIPILTSALWWTLLDSYPDYMIRPLFLHRHVCSQWSGIGCLLHVICLF